MFPGFLTFRKMTSQETRKQGFLICPRSGNMTRLGQETVFPGLPIFGKHGQETMFPGLSTFEKHGYETIIPGLSTFGKHDQETNAECLLVFPSIPCTFGDMTLKTMFRSVHAHFLGKWEAMFNFLICHLCETWLENYYMLTQ